MTSFLDQDNQGWTERSKGPMERVIARLVQPKSCIIHSAALHPLGFPASLVDGRIKIPLLWPMCFNRANKVLNVSEQNKWTPWAPGINTDDDQRFIVAPAASGGTFTLTINGEVTTAIPWTATFADVNAALAALPGYSAADFLVYTDHDGIALANGSTQLFGITTVDFQTGATSMVFRIKFVGKLANQYVTASMNAASLTSVTSHSNAETATTMLNLAVIDGFLFPSEKSWNLTGSNSIDDQTFIAQILLKGTISYKDLPFTVGGVAADENAFYQVLLNSNLRHKGLIITDVPHSLSSTYGSLDG